jgi:hypothetical protein
MNLRLIRTVACVGLNATITLIGCAWNDFRTAEGRNTIAAYENFLRVHPDGEYAALAKERILALEREHEAREHAADMRKEAAELKWQKLREGGETGIKTSTSAVVLASLIRKADGTIGEYYSYSPKGDSDADLKKAHLQMGAYLRRRMSQTVFAIFARTTRVESITDSD